MARQSVSGGPGRRGNKMGPTTPRPPKKPPPSSGPSGGGGGGGRGGGGGGGKPKDDKKLSMGELAAQYGYAAAFFKSDSELRKLIQQAVKGQWSTAKFQAKFQATKWYRQHSADTRTWLELEARDPKEAAQRVKEQTAAIRQQANQMGISLSYKRAKKMARESLLMGWNDQFVTRAIVDEFDYEPGKTSGETASLETFIKETAGNYGVRVSDGRVGNWIGKTLRGAFTEDHITDLLTDQARSRYPGLANYFDQGLTTADVAEPYRQSYSNLLETPFETVDLFDPLIQKALQGTRNEKAKPGDPPDIMNLYDFETRVRKDGRWQFTNNARKSAMDSTLGVLQDWGLYA